MTQITVTYRYCGLAALLLGAAGACSSSDARGANDPVGESSNASITAASGGELTVAGARLQVPGGAVESDTEITATVVERESVPSPGDTRAPVYEFGPAGLTFNDGAEPTITIDAEEPPPSDGAYFAAVLDEERNILVPLANSKVTENEDGTYTVEAQVKHFSRFTIMVVFDNSDAACAAQEDFTPCGGDVTGAWQFSSTCVESSTSFSISLDSCGDFSFSLNVSTTGIVEYNADNTYTSQAATSGEFVYSFPTDCIPGLECSTFGASFPGGSVEESGGACRISSAIDVELSNVSGSWSTEGNNLTQDGTTATYCVSGDQLTVQSETPFGTVTSVATRL